MIKTYTDIKQSNKLIEFLPLDSADMYYINGSGRPVLIGWAECEHDHDDIPCWSLGRLFELIQINCRIEKTMFDQSGIFLYDISTEDNDFRTHTQEELIDACIEFILELEKRDLLF